MAILSRPVRKIDNDKFGFFDFPKEIRDLVYKAYFSHGEIAIHLIKDSASEPWCDLEIEESRLLRRLGSADF